MKRQRKYKVISIIALIFAIVGLSIGFAAFQKVLNITSTAEVLLPTEEDYKARLYGLINIDEFNLLYAGKKANYLNWSSEKSYLAQNTSQLNYEYYATIDNNNLSVDISNIEFVDPWKNFDFYFLLRNESDSNVYVYLSEESLNKLSSSSSKYWDATCQAIGDTTTSLVDAACQNVKLELMRANLNYAYSDQYNANRIDGSFLRGNFKLSSNSEMVFKFRIRYYGDNIADGPFSVDFNPIKIEHGFTPASYYNTASINEDA